MEALVISLVDIWPVLKLWKLWMRIGVSLVGYLFGITLLAVVSTVVVAPVVERSCRRF